MRTLSAGVTSKIAESMGTEPVILVDIFGRHLASKTGTYLGVPHECRIVQIGSISNQVKIGGAGSVGSMSITIADQDNYIKTHFDNNVIDGESVSVWQTFEGIDDKTLLFQGVVVSPFEWDEGERTLTINVESRVISRQIGYAMQEGDFTDGNPEAFGKPWPIIFGKPAHVPTVLARKHAEGTLRHGISLSGSLYKLENVTEITLLQAENVKSLLGTSNVINQIDVNGGSKFPQNQEITIVVDNLCLFTGSFSGDIFTVTESNVPMYSNVSLTARGSYYNDEGAFGQDTINSANYAWLSPANNPMPNLVGRFCSFRWAAPNGWHKETVRCIKQEYNRVKFQTRPTVNRLEKKLGPTDVIHEVRAISATGLVDAIEAQVEKMVEKIKTLSNQLKSDNNAGKRRHELLDQLEALKTQASGYWSADAGATVRVWSKDDPDVYIVSLAPGATINSVYGVRRAFKSRKKDTFQEQVFVPVPKSYYSIDNNYNIPGFGAITVLLFYAPLKSYDDKWGEDIYVTATAADGRNTAVQIASLFNNYSNYSIDSTSFNDVATKIASFPSDFVLTEQRDVLQVCEEIAWQARCGLHIENSVVKISYISEEPTPIIELNGSNVLFKSAVVNFTATEDLKTIMIANYNESSRPLLEHESAKSKRTFVRVTHNETKYGHREETKDFYIYNHPTLVSYSASFWLNRMSRLWRTVKLTTFLNALPLEVYDSVILNIPDLAPVTKAVVSEIDYDTTSKLMTVTLWLPIEAGSNTISTVAWYNDLGFVTPTNPSDSFVEDYYDPKEVDLITSFDDAIERLKKLHSNLYSFGRIKGEA